MASIEITRVGTSDLSALKRNFANLLQEKLGASGRHLIAKRGLTDKKVQSSSKRRAKYIPAGPMHAYPTIHEVQHRLTIEAQGPLVTYDGDGGFLQAEA